SLFHSDAAERGAIGKSGMFLYRFMTTCRQPMMPAQLAAATRLSINQVNYALAKLRRYGIIQRTPAGWQVEDHTDLQLGRITLTAGRGAARQRRHIRDRELLPAAVPPASVVTSATVSCTPGSFC
ncbi:MAG: FaeA/PapI family transcriptional regulator, partial [Anaerolineae bacterium]|nr:FaeA/PapI family transcriptional regulator [Anaerolineae bacterium]